MQFFSNTSKRVTIFGGSGFIGRYIVRRLAALGWKIKIVTRNSDKSLFLRTYGEIGQVEIIKANLFRSETEMEKAIIGSSIVINCIGILTEFGDQKFDEIHFRLVKKMAVLSTNNGIKKFIHISSIGADSNSNSSYSRSKGFGENALIKEFKNHVILRPSVVFGSEDQFFNRFAEIVNISPFIPLVGSSTFFQPVFVDDIALAVEKSAEDKSIVGVYEIGGPEVLNFQTLMVKMLKVMNKSRLIIGLPFIAGMGMAFIFFIVNLLTFGFIVPQITFDQVRQLKKNNTVSKNVKNFSDLNITPKNIDLVLPEYLSSR